MKRRFIPSPLPHKWVVPEGVTSIHVRMRGAGGGGNYDGPGEEPEIKEHTYAVEPGQIIEIVVGTAGAAGDGGVPGLDGFAEIEWITPKPSEPD